MTFPRIKQLLCIASHPAHAEEPLVKLGVSVDIAEGDDVDAAARELMSRTERLVNEHALEKSRAQLTNAELAQAEHERQVNQEAIELTRGTLARMLHRDKELNERITALLMMKGKVQDPISVPIHGGLIHGGLKRPKSGGLGNPSSQFGPLRAEVETPADEALDKARCL